MDIGFFIILVSAVVLGVSIANHPDKVLSTIWEATKLLSWFSLVVGSLGFTYLISFVILMRFNHNTTAPVPEFLVMLGSGIIAILLTGLLSIFVFNIKNHGLSKGVKITYDEYLSDRKKEKSSG